MTLPFGLSTVQAAVIGAVIAAFAGVSWYAWDADRAYVRERTEKARLKDAFEQQRQATLALERQRQEDQRKLLELGQREAAIQRALDRARADYAALAAEIERLVAQDPVAAGRALGRRLHDWMRRVGAPDDRGAQ